MLRNKGDLIFINMNCDLEFTCSLHNRKVFSAEPENNMPLYKPKCEW
jgi:hypothetical protein